MIEGDHRYGKENTAMTKNGPSPAPPRTEADFLAAYDAVLARWPLPVEAVDVPSPYGTTRVNVCGPPDAPPLVLLHGGGATSTVWFANVADLGRSHRLYAVDQIGDVGRSVQDGRPVRRAEDLVDWLDGLLDELGLRSVRLCGHSSGGWLALTYALHAPDRVERLALVEPTRCFTALSPGYLLHALPPLIRPSGARQRRFLGWETAGVPLDAGWLDLVALGAEALPRPRPVVARLPRAARLRELNVPALVVLAGRSRAHSVRRVTGRARRVPGAVVTTLPGATHHSLPMVPAGPLDHRLLEFFAS
jgi:pimeloyl-ACP methyl ester carboxylesterase